MRNFILDTDWFDDCDDCAALRLLLRAHKAGEIALKAIVVDAAMADSVTSVEGFLNIERADDPMIPIGIDCAADDLDAGHTAFLKRTSYFCRRFHRNEDAEDGVRLYRRILSESRERVEIVSIGYMQVIEKLLKSAPDDISDKTGLELFTDKVAKVWVMGGKWDVDGGKENNFARCERSRRAAHYVLSVCPAPITFLGFEVGEKVLTCNRLTPSDILCRLVFDWGSFFGHPSWDPMLAHLAVVGDAQKAGYSLVRGFASVDEATGENHFFKDGNGPHAYVVKEKPDEFYADEIDRRIHA